jgi:hypothetical protein
MKKRVVLLPCSSRVILFESDENQPKHERKTQISCDLPDKQAIQAATPKDFPEKILLTNIRTSHKTISRK